MIKRFNIGVGIVWIMFALLFAIGVFTPTKATAFVMALALAWEFIIERNIAKEAKD